jgi:hypothetical protein
MRHWSPTQQPAQFVASHWPTPHARFAGSHDRPCWPQSVHVEPEVPHAAESVPARHVEVPLSKLQQPPGQLLAPQLATVRPHAFFASQNWKPFAMQSEQR